MSSEDRVIRAAQLGMLMTAALATIKFVAGVSGNPYALVAHNVETPHAIFSSRVRWG